MSVHWWRNKHNKHHNAPNQLGKDPDIAIGVVAFTPDHVARRTGLVRWLGDRQGWLFFPLLTLEGLNLHVASIRHLVRRGATRLERIEAAVVVSRLGGYVAAAVHRAAAGQGRRLPRRAAGACSASASAPRSRPNHKGMPMVPATMKLDFLRRQVLMSRNIRGGVFVDFAMGGLNYQIEHHLFPSMPRPNLRQVQPIVREYCEVHGVTYTEVGAVRVLRDRRRLPEQRRPAGPRPVRVPARRHHAELIGGTNGRN